MFGDTQLLTMSSHKYYLHAKEKKRERKTQKYYSIVRVKKKLSYCRDNPTVCGV